MLYYTGCNPSVLGAGASFIYDKIMCQPPLITHYFGIKNGIVCYTGTAIGSTAYYYCLSCDHTKLANRISKRTCMENGNWNGTAPQCKCNYTMHGI